MLSIVSYLTPSLNTFSSSGVSPIVAVFVALVEACSEDNSSTFLLSFT